ALQQISIRVARGRLASRTMAALDANAREALQEQLQSHVEILERERQLADALLARQAREVELRLADLTPPEASDTLGRPTDANMADARRGAFRGRGGGDSSTRSRPDLNARGLRPGPPAVEIAASDYQFGFDPNLDSVSAQRHAYFQESTEPNTASLKADYQAQTLFVLGSDNETLAEQARQELSSMTPVYYEICGYQPKGILWLHTCLDVGLYTTYPGGVPPRKPLTDDPRRADWYQRAAGWAQNARFRPGPSEQGPRPDGAPQPTMPQRDGARRNGPGTQDTGGRRGGGFGRGRGGWSLWAARIRIEARQGAPTVDPFTNQVVVVRSVPVRYADGSFAGATAVVRTIPEIFASMKLPERWGTDIERMLVLVDPNAPPDRSTQILLHDGLADDNTTADRRRRMFSPELRSNDSEMLRTVVDDIVKGVSGVRAMEYKGRMCLWAYQPLDIPQVAAFLIVPQERVVELARTMEQSLLKESLFWLQGATMVVLVVAVVAVVLAAMKARDVTNPINALIEAGRKLGGGDYDAQVELTTGDEFEQLGRVFNEAGPKLREREKMKRSLELAAAIQQSLLPGRAPAVDRFEISGRCVYCDETGGDYYDFIDLSQSATVETRRLASQATEPNRVGLVVGDVSGHGIGAALLMAATRGMLHAEAGYHADDLSRLFQSLNARLLAEMVDDRFVTLFYGLLDSETRALVWASAGHEPAIWYHAETGRVEELPNTGMPLGVMADTPFEQAGPIVLAPGDVLVVGTDGIHEAQDLQGQFFGKPRFLEAIRSQASLSADEICDAVIDDVTQFVHPASRTDDITLIVIKAKP
ncbi:MAG: SpoIIE family protein phosphatase, partial [Sedimentisphaerales bacterium]|nr:SpoIIE family protein phosphatase [Sedimentisphaerales bacterium]